MTFSTLNMKTQISNLNLVTLINNYILISCKNENIGLSLFFPYIKDNCLDHILKRKRSSVQFYQVQLFYKKRDSVINKNFRKVKTFTSGKRHLYLLTPRGFSNVGRTLSGVGANSSLWCMGSQPQKLHFYFFPKHEEGICFILI